MSKTFKVPTPNNETRTVEGSVVILPLGNRKLRAFIHMEGSEPVLSHCESGYRICSLFPYKLIANRNYQPESNRDAAIMALQDLAAKVGIEKAWNTIDNAPVINGKA